MQYSFPYAYTQTTLCDKESSKGSRNPIFQPTLMLKSCTKASVCTNSLVPRPSPIDFPAAIDNVHSFYKLWLKKVAAMAAAVPMPLHSQQLLVIFMGRPGIIHVLCIDCLISYFSFPLDTTLLNTQNTQLCEQRYM